MTAGSSSTNHYGVYEADNLYSQTVDGVTAQYVPVSGNYYSSTSGRKYSDTFIRDVCSRTNGGEETCLLYTSPSPRDGLLSRMPSSA